MKCIILAGGAGDRLWPLSRKNYPKQFLNINHNNSLFQETITRNIPFCDEFVIVTNLSYQAMIESQMKQFQGLPYRVVYEEIGKGTAPALAYVSQMLGEEEDVMLLPADLYLDGDGYSDGIYEAKRLADAGSLVLFGIHPDRPSTAYGYIRTQGSHVLRFIEKPSEPLADKIFADNDTFWNSGMLLARNQYLQEQLQQYLPGINEWAKLHSNQKEKVCIISSESVEHIQKVSVEKGLLERSSQIEMAQLHCEWKDVSSLEVYQQLRQQEDGQQVITNVCEDVTVVNESERQLVVANGLSHVMIVNTDDAIYVSDKDTLNEIKGIVAQQADHYKEYFEDSTTVYRQWGYRKMISQEKGYRARKVTIYPGASISKHIHNKRTETYSIVGGILSVDLQEGISNPDNLESKVKLGVGESINILPGQMHRIYNETDENVTIIEVDTGAEIDEEDMLHQDTLSKLATEESKQILPSLYRLHPAFKDYLWGGQRLVELFGKDSPYEITAESWELSAHSAGQSQIVGGPLDGTAFGDFVARYGRQVCGWKSAAFDRFPILIKFIDALNPLSVQIHPYDDYAFVHEKEFGKNEMWYVMDAAPEAFLYCGFNRAVTRKEVEQRITDHTITEVLNKVPVQKGDCLFIPAGTIHAIGAGILICEIQQNSNSTYRVYDYDRRDAQGNTRELHIAKALDVMHFEEYHQGAYGLEPAVRMDMDDAVITTQQLCQCKYFQCEKYTVDGEALIYMEDASFVSLVFLSGSARVNCGDETMDVKAGDSIFVSAGRKVVHVIGECEFIETNI